ncbi:MAG: hypothetical protein Q4G35_01575 [Propionibacteriaceae bacterium]|nr:hypothetical protein [Propionibacteriaceae bacterium]
MLDEVVQAESARRRAEELLSEGIPLGLTVATAAAYVQQCQDVLDEIESHDLPPVEIKLRAAQIIVPSALRSAQCDLDSAAAAAVELQQRATRLGDPVARAYALAAWGMTRPGPEYTARRVEAANEILDIATRYDDTALVPVGYALLLTGLLEQGEIRSLDTELLERRAAAAARQDRPQENPAAWFRCLRLILDGDAEGAEQQAKALFDQSPQSGSVAGALYTTQVGMIRWMQGRIDGAEEGFLRSRREYPEQLLWPASLAWLWLLQGRRTSGETLLKSLPPLDEIPRDRYWLSTMTVLAEIARISGTRENALHLRGLLLPYSAHLVPVGIGVSFWGTAARTLGLLEEQLGMLEEARTHLELAIEMSARIGALAWHAEAQIELAEFGIRHDLADIPSYELLSEARTTSEARGFAALAQRAMHRPRIRVLGGFEVVSLCGRRAEWTSRKARELLKMLVAAHGVATSREVFMDVLWPGESPASLGNRFSVAVNVIRRALDPQRLRSTQHHVVTEGDAVRLAVDHLDIDLERFLALARRPDGASRRAATKLYRGAAFSEEPYTDWAVEVRDHAEHLHRRLIESMDS